MALAASCFTPPLFPRVAPGLDGALPYLEKTSMEDRTRLTEALADRYRIGRLIGSGGMATVYLAEDIRHERPVGVKVLHPEMARAMGQERFLREIRTAANLTHPHILPVFDSGEADGLFYYVMPYIQGESLETRLDKEAQLPVADAIRITRQIADALAYAHNKGVIHRDIKPANIMLEAGHAFLTDFGVAHAARNAQNIRLTQTGATLGTPTYMSPEQATGEKEVDGRTDQYSLGCVLYQMLTGSPPFRGPKGEAVVRQHLTADPVPVRQIRPLVPLGVTEALSTALAKTPADRFPNMSAFGRALGRQTEGGWGSVAPTHVKRAPGVTGMWGRAFERIPGGPRKAMGLSVVLVATAIVGKALTGNEAQPLSALADWTFHDSVMVIPAEGVSIGQEWERIRSVLSTEVVRRLNRSRVVKASDQFSVQRLLALDISAREMADTLGVDKAISIQIFPRMAGSDGLGVLNINVSDVRRGTYEFDQDFELSPDASIEEVGEVSQHFVESFLSRYPSPASRAILGPTAQGPGYESYILGMNSLARRTPLGIANALRSFEEATIADPTDAFAFSGLSKSYALADAYRYRTDADGYETPGLAMAYARRAIELEPNLADAYSARLLMARRSFAPPTEVASDCQKAMELEPGNADGLSWCGPTLSQQGEADLGFQAAEQAVKLDPQNAGRRVALSYIALALGDHEEAAYQARMASSLEPEMLRSTALEAWALLLSGNPSGCAALRLGPHAAIRATCLFELGNTLEAQAMVDSVEAALEAGISPDSPFTAVVFTEGLAVYYAWIGAYSKAMNWIRRSYELSPSGVEARILESALFDRIRTTPSFESEVRRLHSGIWERVQRAAEEAYQERFGSGQPE